VCEASENYLWALGDKVGSGATSHVYKAYNITTGKIVAAKVSKIQSALYKIRPTHQIDAENKSDSRSIFDREINFLRNIDHDNIVRFIDTEIVISSNDSNAPLNREVIFIEYCNGGSVGDMLRLTANRYGLPEDIIMQIMKDVTNALKYLRMKNIVSSQNYSFDFLSEKSRFLFF
jgi:serine/threonine protein kinase